MQEEFYQKKQKSYSAELENKRGYGHEDEEGQKPNLTPLLGIVRPLPNLVVVSLLPNIVEIYYLTGVLRTDHLLDSMEFLSICTNSCFKNSDFTTRPKLLNTRPIQRADKKPKGVMVLDARKAYI